MSVVMADAATSKGGDGPAAARSRDAAFSKARRHSRRVRLLKFLLPAVAVVIAGVFVGYSMLSSSGVSTVNFGMPTVEDGNLVMSNPKLDGFTADDLPYKMSAARAKQALGGGSDIRLEKISAEVPLDKETSASIKADTGTYNRQSNRLDIDSPLTLTTSSGIVARLQSADVDIDANELSTTDPVDVDMKGTHIAAKSLETREGGKVFVFRDRVRVTIEPSALDDEGAEKGSQADD